MDDSSYDPYAGDTSSNNVGMFPSQQSPQSQPGFLDYLRAFHQAQSQPAPVTQNQSGLLFPWRMQQQQHQNSGQGLQRLGLCGKLI